MEVLNPSRGDIIFYKRVVYYVHHEEGLLLLHPVRPLAQLEAREGQLLHTLTHRTLSARQHTTHSEPKKGKAMSNKEKLSYLLQFRRHTQLQVNTQHLQVRRKRNIIMEHVYIFATHASPVHHTATLQHNTAHVEQKDV